MKSFAKVSAALAVAMMLLTGCNCYNRMAKKSDQLRASSSPELLTLRGTEVNADITVTFPAKYFNKNAVIRITPVLVYDGGELSAAPKYLQGEKVRDNYTVISTKNGGTYTQAVTFPYNPSLDMSELYLVVEAKCKKGDYHQIDRIPVARGVSTVQKHAQWTAYLSIMPDNFRRITTISQDADIVYNINSAQIRTGALNSEDVKLLEDFVRQNANRDRTTLGNVYAKGYASPDGPVRFNDELSQRRSQSGQDAISKQLRGVDAQFDAAAYGEDWDGFQKLVQASDIPDKDLILQVLQMYNSPIQRDEQIKNMSQVFEVLKRDVLPQLRRTQLVATADIEGLTDQELRSAAMTDVLALNLEETLYAATLFDNVDTQERLYRTAAERFDNERAYNNYGVMLARQGQYEQARTAFNKAASINSAPEISNNLGVIALTQGDIAEAKRYLDPLGTADAASNRGLVALAVGDYAGATRGLEGYNLAVAEFTNGNLSQAKAALGNSTAAQADYLRAVIAMREGDSQGAIYNLTNAISKDPDLRARAHNDIEFHRLFDLPEFRNL